MDGYAREGNPGGHKDDSASRAGHSFGQRGAGRVGRGTEQDAQAPRRPVGWKSSLSQKFTNLKPAPSAGSGSGPDLPGALASQLTLPGRPQGWGPWARAHRPQARAGSGHS